MQEGDKMKYNIILGFKDIITKPKYAFMLFICVLSITIVFISSTMSLIEANKEVRKEVVTYNLVPTSTNLDDYENIKEPLLLLFEKGGSTYYQSYYLNYYLGINALVFIGDTTDMWFQDEPIALEGNHVYVTSEEYLEQSNQLLEHINQELEVEILDSTLLSKSRNLSNYGFIITISNDSLNNWLPYFSKYEVIEVVANTNFSNDDIENQLDEKFSTIFDNDNFILNKNIYINDEADFIFNYIYIIIISSILVILSCVAIIYKSILKNMYREYAIHYISGANIYHIFIRNSILNIVVGFMVLAVMFYLEHFTFTTLFMYSLCFIALLLALLEIVLLFVMKRQNITLLLKGEFE